MQIRPRQIAPVIVDAFATDSDVSEISIVQGDDPSIQADRHYAADGSPERTLTLYGGLSGKLYNVAVSWADGSSYTGSVTDTDTGAVLSVTSPS